MGGGKNGDAHFCFSFSARFLWIVKPDEKDEYRNLVVVPSAAFLIGLQVLESILLTDPEKIVASCDCIGCLEKSAI